ncbi:MAG: MnhB domain-containing protein [Chloroflexota bacterium]|nr:MnhB domain-containing protein [Chloroflexota bacterium]
MLDRYGSVVVELVSRAVVPAIQLFALYVITHGHYGPGGGFQGGVLMAASILLLRLTQGREESFRRFPPGAAFALAALGMLLFILTGLASVALGGAFLDYATLSFPGASPATLRYYGILVVEVAIALTVWGTLVVIVDQIGRRTDDV